MDPTNPSAECRVLIVGAGPTGLVHALWLTHLGIRVRVIDKAPQAGTTSRALGVHARTLEFYRQLGIADEVVGAGVKAAGVNFWVRGSRAARIALSEMGEGQTAFPYLLIYPQDAHERLLIGRLSDLGVRVERPTELLGFVRHGGFVRATLRRADGSQEVVDAEYLAGCDGASSTVRHALATEFPGGTYSHLFYVADVEADGPPADNEVHIDLESADFLGVFPLTRNGHVRVVGSVRDSLAGRRQSLSFDDVRGQTVRNLKLRTGKVNWFSTYRVHHRVAGSFRQGRVFLLGDAAHVHSPVGAQGMNTGIGDAVNLSWKLASVLTGAARDDLLDTYETERIGFARRLVATTDRIFTLVTNPSRAAARARTGLIPLLLPGLFGIDAFRRSLFRTFSQIAVSYRKSPLSAGSAGGVHGGDRLPWVATSAGADNHAALAGVAWGAHVYGDSREAVEEACSELGLPLHRFPWQPAMEEAGLEKGGLYLVRPDGYVALAASSGGPQALRDYVSARGLSVAAEGRHSAGEALLDGGTATL
jgi:2-polyprenyl-6-methoxyphenol hydroxylase-like FAD-dependent oxidoreductase